MGWINSLSPSFGASYPRRVRAIDVAARRQVEVLGRWIEEGRIWRHNAEGVLQQIMENQMDENFPSYISVYEVEFV